MRDKKRGAFITVILIALTLPKKNLPTGPQKANAARYKCRGGYYPPKTGGQKNPQDDYYPKENGGHAKNKSAAAFTSSHKDTAPLHTIYAKKGGNVHFYEFIQTFSAHS